MFVFTHIQQFFPDMSNSIFGYSIPKVTFNLLVINFLAFFASATLQRFGIDVDYLFGLHYYKAEEFNITQLITYAFLHANFSHIFFNMFALFMFGRVIEMLLGTKRYIIFYLVCAIGAGVAQEAAWAVSIPESLAFQYSGYITVGASGSVFGLLLAFAMMLPNEPIFLWFIPIPIKAKYFVLVYALLELYGGVASSGDNVAHFAHLGGMVFGFLLLQYWKKKNKTSEGEYF